MPIMSVSEFLNFKNMKRILSASLFILILTPVIRAVTVSIPTPIHWTWQYPTNAVTPDMVFIIEGTPNIAQPMASITNVSVTNLVPVATNGANYTYSIGGMVSAGQGYYAVVVSNFWGLTAQSPIYVTPPVAVPAINFSLGLGLPPVP